VKLHFDADLDYQRAAIDAVCDLFDGQEVGQTGFTVVREAGRSPALFGVSDLGVGNRLSLVDEEILQNLQAVQRRNGLTTAAALKSGDFTIEMETGTGKTYVYLRTIFELNRRYGFTKFVIVVPSVAIKEGVYHSLETMTEHFRALYDGVPFEYFQYDSAKLGLIRSFATSPHIQVMVTTVAAINKIEVVNFYKESERLAGERPADLVKATHPILIVDEPQSVDGGLKGAGKKALDDMNPLCVLRYSATHVNTHHMVYRLDAIDAYQKKLVKQIEVAAATVEDGYNHAYIRVASTQSKHGDVTARVELDCEVNGRPRRTERTVRQFDDLRQVTGRGVYDDYMIGEISARDGGSFVEVKVPGGQEFLSPGEARGDVGASEVQRAMIRRTIIEHLHKEQRLRAGGIKVLTLFFIDSVERYRTYDKDGNPVKGSYAQIFEEEYQRAQQHPRYQALFDQPDLSTPAGLVHDGYFSVDKRSKRLVDTTERNAGGREAAEDAYNLIMRDKERLLSFQTKLKFIFSHSALREGWDNPNIFQICTLRDMRSETERRQTIGRGLRLCVNQAGERVHGFEFNTLTVIASESYEEFAENLQREIEADTGIRFGLIRPDAFAAISFVKAGDTVQLGTEASRALFCHFEAAGYVDANGRVTDVLRKALKEGAVSLPDEFGECRAQVLDLTRKLAGRLEIKNADERRSVKARKELLYGTEFKELWERIKHKTTYRVAFDNEQLIADSAGDLRHSEPVPFTRLRWRAADIAIGRSGVEATEQQHGADLINLGESGIDLPDFLTELQNRTQLTRRSICRILDSSGRIADVKRNPQLFIERAAKIINVRKQLALVTGIKYHKVTGSEFYVQEIFEAKELAGYLNSMLSGVRKSVMESVLYDSLVERGFAEALEANDRVIVYAKLPQSFTIPTPLGSYNPDWAVVAETPEGEKLFFVIETKGDLDNLRERENAKIKCGEAHFEAIAGGSNPARFISATALDVIFQ
jgi:type III restriction enzyme